MNVLKKSFLTLSRVTFLTMSKRDSCIFCYICDGKDTKTKILYQDDEMVVFPDIRPATSHHFLVVTREHILDVKHLTKDQTDVVEKLVAVGKQVLETQGGDLQDVRYGFHWPPFKTVSHLHCHVISPTREMGFFGRIIFRPNSWWFTSPEKVIEWLQEQEPKL